jgi:hypothetical protein
MGVDKWNDNLYGQGLNIRKDQKQKAEVLGPLACTWTSKLKQPSWCNIDAAELKEGRKVWKPPCLTGTEKTLNLAREPMYRGQGKIRNLSNNQCNIADIFCDQAGDERTAQGARLVIPV